MSDVAVKWIAHNIIANEMTLDPLPSELQESFARLLVEDDYFGWPSIDEAFFYLRTEFNWTEKQS